MLFGQVGCTFFGGCQNIFPAKMVQPPPLEKIGPYRRTPMPVCHFDIHLAYMMN